MCHFQGSSERMYLLQPFSPGLHETSETENSVGGHSKPARGSPPPITIYVTKNSNGDESDEEEFAVTWSIYYPDKCFHLYGTRGLGTVIISTVNVMT